MSSPAGIDYDALAAQHGAITGKGSVDYDALAQQHGGSSSHTGPNVSPGASDEDIIRSFGYDPAVIAKSPMYQQTKKNGGKISDMLTDPNRHDLTSKLANSWFGDVGQGAMDLIEGTSQLGHHLFSKLGLANQEDTPFFDLLTKVQQQDYLQNIRHGNSHPLARMAGNLVAGGALPAIEAAPEAGLAARVATGAANGVVAGVTQPVDVPGSGNYWGAKAKQAATGAAVGAAVPAVVGGAARGIAKVATKVRNAPTVQLPEQVAAEAERANTQAQGTADAANLAAQGQGNAMTTRAETEAANARSAAQGGAQQRMEQLRGRMTQTSRNATDVTAAADAGDRHAALVADQVANAGEDPARLYESGINLQNWRAGQVANEKYNQVGDLVEHYSLGPVPLPGTSKALNRIEVDARLGLRDRGLDRTLEDIRKALTPETPAAAKPSGLVDASGSPVTPPRAPAPQMQTDYSTARKVVSQLDQIIRTGRTGDNALVTDRGIGQLQQIKNSIEGDASQYVQKSGVPELQEAQKSADDFYRSEVVPFKDRTVAQAGTTDEPDTIFKKFVMAGRGDRAQKFYNALDPKGKAAVQYEIVADAFNKATDQTTGEFNPKTFFTSLDKVKEAHGVFFQGRDRMVVDGLRKLMTQAIDQDASLASVKSLAQAGVKRAADVGDFNVKATQEAGAQKVADITARVQQMEKFPLGSTAAAAAGASGTLAAMHMTTPAIVSGSYAAIAGSLRTLMRTDAGRRFLLASSFLTPGSRALISRVDQLAIGKVTSRAATNPVGQSEIPPTLGSTVGSGSAQQQQKDRQGTDQVAGGSF